MKKIKKNVFLLTLKPGHAWIFSFFLASNISSLFWGTLKTVFFIIYWAVKSQGTYSQKGLYSCLYFDEKQLTQTKMFSTEFSNVCVRCWILCNFWCNQTREIFFRPTPLPKKNYLLKYSTVYCLILKQPT